MSRDRDIERTIRHGERNQDAKRLIHNWCRHARVEKFGGSRRLQSPAFALIVSVARLSNEMG